VRGFDHGENLGLGHARHVGPLVGAEQPQGEIGDPREQQHNGPHETGKNVNGLGDLESDRIGMADRKRLRNQLPVHDAEERKQNGHHHKGNGRGIVRDESHRNVAQPIVDIVGQGNSAHRGGEEPRDGNADLHGRQKASRILGEVESARGGRVSLFGECSQARFAGGDERKLGSGQERVDAEEQHDDEKFDQQARHRESVRAFRGTGARPHRPCGRPTFWEQITEQVGVGGDSLVRVNSPRTRFVSTGLDKLATEMEN